MLESSCLSRPGKGLQSDKPICYTRDLSGERSQEPPPAVARRVCDRAQCLREISRPPLHPATSHLGHPGRQLSQPDSFQRTD